MANPADNTVVVSCAANPGDNTTAVSCGASAAPPTAPTGMSDIEATLKTLIARVTQLEAENKHLQTQLRGGPPDLSCAAGTAPSSAHVSDSTVMLKTLVERVTQLEAEKKQVSDRLMQCEMLLGAQRNLHSKTHCEFDLGDDWTLALAGDRMALKYRGEVREAIGDPEHPPKYHPTPFPKPVKAITFLGWAVDKTPSSLHVDRGYPKQLRAEFAVWLEDCIDSRAYYGSWGQLVDVVIFSAVRTVNWEKPEWGKDPKHLWHFRPFRQ